MSNLRSVVAEYVDMLRVNTEANGAVVARLELVDVFDRMPSDTAAWLAVTALEMLMETT